MPVFSAASRASREEYSTVCVSVVLAACSEKTIVTSVSPSVQSSSHISVKTSRSGGAISRKTPLIPMSSPLPWLQTKRRPPPGFRFILQTVSRQSSSPYNQRFTSSGLVQASNTRCRGASKTRIIATSRSLGVVTCKVPLFFIGALPLCASTFFLLRFKFLQHAIEALEIAFPNASVPFDPDFELLQRRGAQCINAALRIHAHVHQSSVAEHAQMLRDLRLTEAQAMDHIADGPRPFAQQFDDLKAVGLGQRLQGFHHGGSEYASSRIFVSRYILYDGYIATRVCFEHNLPPVPLGLAAQSRKLEPVEDFLGGLHSCAQLLFFSRPRYLRLEFPVRCSRRIFRCTCRNPRRKPS